MVIGITAERVLFIIRFGQLLGCRLTEQTAATIQPTGGALRRKDPGCSIHSLIYIRPLIHAMSFSYNESYRSLRRSNDVN